MREFLHQLSSCFQLQAIFILSQQAPAPAPASTPAATPAPTATSSATPDASGKYMLRDRADVNLAFAQDLSSKTSQRAIPWCSP